MPDSSAPQPAPQFQTAEYVSGHDVCRTCQQPIAAQYFRVNGAMTCPTCAANAQQAIPKPESGAYAKALAFGCGAALVGTIGYAAFEIATGWIIGYVSLAVGWLIATAMMKGSKGIGGRKYQVTAALLTYAAVSMAFVPMAIHQYGKQERQKKEAIAQQTTPAPSATKASAPAPKVTGATFVLGLLTLVGIGLVSPFLELQEGFSGIIGLVILLVGIQIAWKIAAGRPGLAVEGPYQNS